MGQGELHHQPHHHSYICITNMETSTDSYATEVKLLGANEPPRLSLGNPAI